MSISTDELLILLVILAIFLSILIYLAFDRIIELIPYCRSGTVQSNHIESYIRQHKADTADDRTSSVASTARPVSARAEPQQVEPAVTIRPLTRTDAESESSREPRQSSQNFMKILEKIEAQDNDAIELAAERERRRRRRLQAEEERLLTKAASSSSNVLEVNSSDETGSQTLIGLPAEAAPKDPGQIQLGLIVAQDHTPIGSQS